jgi:hypothetical protein
MTGGVCGAGATAARVGVSGGGGGKCSISNGRNAGAIDGDNAGSFGGSGSTSGISSTSFG